ncbi:MAG: hypothetical protein JWS12_301 [Candidatus Saccharibacteria bacterium]|nr:hypothetical protein [Candidatus Saccharibacteria bacterium]
MPAKKKTSKKSKSKSKFLNRVASSQRNLIVFVLVFALLGSYLVWRTFAASQVGQVLATNFTTTAPEDHIAKATYTDSGKKLILKSSHAATAKITLTNNATRFVLRAKASACQGWPNVWVVTDYNKQILMANVNSGTWTSYSANVTVPAGTHDILVVVSNSLETPTCARTLYVDSVTAFNDAPTPPPSDSTPPKVTLTSPANGATISGSVNVAATASDNVGVTKVNFEVDGTQVSSITASPFTYSWDTSKVTNAAHTVKATAYDAANNTNTSTVTVTVNNTTTPPPPPTDTQPYRAAGNTDNLPSKMVFNDDFSGTSLDKTRWAPVWFSDGNTQNGTVMSAANVTVSNGFLNLMIDGNGKGSIVSTNPTAPNGQAGYKGFQFSYGYAESEICLPAAGDGSVANWPAWWTDGQNWPANGELDIMEGLSGHAAATWHGPEGNGAGKGFGNAGSLTGCHKFAANWQNGVVTSYYDGAKLGSYASTSNITSAPQYLIIENSNGQYGGTKVNNVNMKVNYVRVWQ